MTKASKYGKCTTLYAQAVVIGGISGFITFCSTCILDSKPSLDDPCCTFITHGLCGIWGMLAVGIFARVSCIPFNMPPYPSMSLFETIFSQEDDISLGFTFNKYPGIIYGGGYLLGIQVFPTLLFMLKSIDVNDRSHF